MAAHDELDNILDDERREAADAAREHADDPSPAQEERCKRNHYKGPCLDCGHGMSSGT